MKPITGFIVTAFFSTNALSETANLTGLVTHIYEERVDYYNYDYFVWIKQSEPWPQSFSSTCEPEMGYLNGSKDKHILSVLRDAKKNQLIVKVTVDNSYPIIDYTCQIVDVNFPQ